MSQNQINSLMDAIKEDPNGGYVKQDPSTTIETNDEDGKTYIKILPSQLHYQSDSKELHRLVRPGYRLINNTNTTMSTEMPSTTNNNSIIDPNLNEDVTGFLSIINDIGMRIAYLVDAKTENNNTTLLNSRDFVGDMIGDKLNIDSVSTNIIKGVEELKMFFRYFGQKIIPSDLCFNPYYNNDISHLTKKTQSTTNTNGCCRQEINISCNGKNGVQYEKSPYNPTDLNTFINCLDDLAYNSTERDTTNDNNMVHVQVFQSCLGKVKVTKFNDSIIDDHNVGRSQPFYNIMAMMLDVLKIDCKFFNILYQLNLHESFRSPLTNIYYGKVRTKMVDGVPVRTNEVTNSDIHNATLQMVDLTTCILKFISFLDIDSYNRIIKDYFSYDSISNGIQPASDVDAIIIGDTSANVSVGNNQMSNTENIPCFLYGHLLSFCDAVRQVVDHIPLEQSVLDSSPDYDPTKVAAIGYNCTYGMIAVAQLIECLMKSRAFGTVLSMLFPSGSSYDTFLENKVNIRDGVSIPRPPEPTIEFNDKDLERAMRFVIDGPALNEELLIPSNTIPNRIPETQPTYINKILYCVLLTAFCGISRFCYNSEAPCLSVCSFDGDSIIDPDDEHTPTTMFGTTTMPGTTRSIHMGSVRQMTRHFNNIDKNSKKRNTSRSNNRVVFPEINNPENNGVSTDDQFEQQTGIQFLINNIHNSVMTSNNKVLSYLHCYVSAYAQYDKMKFNNRVTSMQERDIQTKPKLSRDLYDLMCRGIN
jgi:hypothetical protein